MVDSLPTGAHFSHVTHSRQQPNYNFSPFVFGRLNSLWLLGKEVTIQKWLEEKSSKYIILMSLDLLDDESSPTGPLSSWRSSVGILCVLEAVQSRELRIIHFLYVTNGAL